jgi:uncharacterized alpha-E superfamily protein
MEDMNMVDEPKTSLLYQIGELKAKLQEQTDIANKSSSYAKKIQEQLEKAEIKIQEMNVVNESNDEEMKRLEKEAFTVQEELRRKCTVCY